MTRSPRTLTPSHIAVLTASALLGCAPQVGPDYAGEPLARIRGVVASSGVASAADVAVLWFSNQGGECEGPTPSCGFGGGGDLEQWMCAEACGPQPEVCGEEVLATYGACIAACGWQFDYLLNWQLCADAAVGERIAVQGEFPAAFTLDLFQPPPEEALLTTADGLRVAYGWFIVVDPEVDDGLEIPWTGDGLPASILGGSGSHVLIYAADPIPADSTWGRFFDGAIDPGYHVITVIPGPGCGVLGQPCVDTYSPSPMDLATEISVSIAPVEDIDWPTV